MSPTTPGTPPAEVILGVEQVRTLLADQHPDLAERPLTPLASGWDNFMFRLGDRLCLRFPRRATAVSLIEHEQRWLGRLGPELPLPIPAPLRTGVPGAGYPWPWSVLPWLPGEPADLRHPGAAAAEALAAFLRALHRPAPPDAPENPVRGVPLESRRAGVEERIARLVRAGDLDETTIREAWLAALDSPIDTGGRWLHGDLHPQNILVDDAGALAGIVDWGDITAGDVATDLASIWMLLTSVAERRRALEAYGPTDATLRRAKGWAVLFGVVLLDTGRIDNPRHAAVGRATLKRVAADS